MKFKCILSVVLCLILIQKTQAKDPAEIQKNTQVFQSRYRTLTLTEFINGVRIVLEKTLIEPSRNAKLSQILLYEAGIVFKETLTKFYATPEGKLFSESLEKGQLQSPEKKAMLNILLDLHSALVVASPNLETHADNSRELAALLKGGGLENNDIKNHLFALHSRWAQRMEQPADAEQLLMKMIEQNKRSCRIVIGS